MNRKLISALLPLLLIALYTGCGTGQVTDEAAAAGDTADEAIVAGPTGPAGQDGADGTDGADGADGADGVGLNVPAGVWLDGVNRIMFYASADGLMIQAEDTTGATNDAGAFNGGGLGNKAFVGLYDYDAMLVSDITSIKFTARQDRGTSYFYLNMQVDCDGNGVWDASDGIVVADFSTVPGLTLTDSFVTTTILPTDAALKMVGGPKASCGNLPSHLGLVGVPLTDLPATAILWNGSTGDGGMPRDTDMASILFVMGDSTTDQQRTMTMQSIAINDDEYVFGQ